MHRSQCDGVFFEGFLLLLLGLHGGDLLFPHRPRRRLTAYERKMMSKSQYIKYDKPNKLWIQHRKVVYLYWFKFLQHAEKNKKFSVDWEKYKSWGGREVVMNTKFDDWWKDYWKDLFSFAEGQPTNAPFHTKKKPEVIAMRTTLLVYERRHKGDKWEIGCAVAKSENAKGRPLAKALEGKLPDGEDFEEMEIVPTYRKNGKLIRGEVRKIIHKDKKGFEYVDIWELTPENFQGRKLVRQQNFKDIEYTLGETPNDKYRRQIESDDVEETSGDLYLKRLLKKRVQGYVSRYFKQADELMYNISQGSLDAPD